MSNFSYTKPPIETAVGPVIIIFVSGMYSIVTVLGFLFNTTIILTIIKARHLHTAMNSHLLGLAISDLFVCLVVIPCRLVLYTGAHSPDSQEARCKLDVFMKTACDSIEFAMLVGMSYERYKSVSKPFDKHNTNRRTVLTIFISCVCSCGVGAITCIKFGDSVTIYPCYREYSFYSRVPLRKFSEAFITLPLCVICLVFIVMYYYLMIQTLKHHNSKLRKSAKIAPIIDHKEPAHAFTLENKLDVASPELTTNVTKLTHSSVGKGHDETVSKPIKFTTPSFNSSPLSKTRKYDTTLHSETENREASHVDMLRGDSQSTQLTTACDTIYQEPVKIHVFTRPNIKRTNSESKLTDKYTWRRIIHEKNVGMSTRPKPTKSSNYVSHSVAGNPHLECDHNLQSIVPENVNGNAQEINGSLKSNSNEMGKIACDNSSSSLSLEANHLDQDTTHKLSIVDTHTIGAESTKQFIKHVFPCKATKYDGLLTNDCQENDKQTSLLQPLQEDNMICDAEKQTSQRSSSTSSQDELLQGTLTADNNKSGGIMTPGANSLSGMNKNLQNIGDTCGMKNTVITNYLNKNDSANTTEETIDHKVFNITSYTDTLRQLTPGHEITSKVDVVEMDGTVHKNVSVEGAVVGAVCVMNKSNRLQGRRRVEMRAAKRIAILIGSFVILWLPLPLTSLYMSSEKQTSPSDLETLLVTGSISALTGAFNPVFNLLLNKQLRSASIRVMKGGIKTCTRFA